MIGSGAVGRVSFGCRYWSVDGDFCGVGLKKAGGTMQRIVPPAVG